MEIRADTQSEAWVAAISALLDAPTVSPRGMLVKEVPERVSVIIARPQAGFVAAAGRRLNHAITAVEGLSLVGQCSVPELVLDRVGAFAPYADDGIFWGAYGPRAAGDVGLVVDLLKRDPDTRQAVISIYDSDRDLGRAVKDVPCTLSIQLFLRDDEELELETFGPIAKRLHMWVTMRSQDAWLGMPYDFGQFSMLQFAVAQAVGAEVGTYTHSLGSLHLYEKHWEQAREVSSPQSYPRGHEYGSSDIGVIASRCRRILLGQFAKATPLEEWLSLQLASKL